MTATTIKIHPETKASLDLFREHSAESYDAVIKKLVFVAKHASEEPELSKKEIAAIEKARKRIAEGHFVTEAELRKRLGLK